MLKRERDVIRQFLGTDKIIALLLRMEHDMASTKEQLSQLKAQFADFVSDVDAKLDQLAQAQGQMDPEAQQVFDDIKQALADADSRVGDADGSEAQASGGTVGGDTSGGEVPAGEPVDPNVDGGVGTGDGGTTGDVSSDQDSGRWS